MDCLAIFGLALLLSGVVQGQPQRPWQVEQQQNPWLRPQTPTGQPQIPVVPGASSSSTTTPTIPANENPRYLACRQTCLVTSEYNPICGSDNNNYYNLNVFNCAVGCGLDIQQVHRGIC